MGFFLLSRTPTYSEFLYAYQSARLLPYISTITQLVQNIQNSPLILYARWCHFKVPDAAGHRGPLQLSAPFWLSCGHPGEGASHFRLPILLTSFFVQRLPPSLTASSSLIPGVEWLARAGLSNLLSPGRFPGCKAGEPGLLFG